MLTVCLSCVLKKLMDGSRVQEFIPPFAIQIQYLNLTLQVTKCLMKGTEKDSVWLRQVLEMTSLQKADLPLILQP